ncbi:NADP-dependent oxidoreductase [Gemmobacter lutimaris]|uniref:NADP-dependent oxidoreductase n=1 Tax=Gemmobacter lutimaris TaxID=2306023 RepID=A0A398BKA9_9RHOB|nr:NADP-dependent oxidoreductase [Gemmobacter lutimaris]RID90842.1 NADP-dependent oxidoreductase [Gemmobacter lutimaris]
MRAIFYRGYGGPEVLEHGTLPDPEPGPGQVLVALEAASVAPLDWKLRAGMLAAHFTPEFPKIPGRDGTGRVLACGPGVTGFAPGQRVAVMAPPACAAGCYASMIAADAALTVPLPDTVGMEEGAALVNSGLSALIACRTAGVTAGQRVLVHSGAGAVGGLLVQLCAHLGAEVSATCHSRNADYVRGLGATRIIAYDRDALSDLPSQDVVFDLMGGTTHAASYAVLKRGGHLVWLTAAPFEDRGAEYGVRITRAMIADDASVVAEVLHLAAQDVLKAQIADRLPLDQAADAQRRLAAGEVSRGRLILLP